MKRKILWADDEIEFLKAHIIFLEEKGYELIPVTNGEDAIALVKQETFDVVLLDEMMPGMDGLRVLAEIKNYDPGIPVVMITKSHEEHIMDDAIGTRINDYLIKPVSPTQIFTTLKRLFDSKQLRDERISREYARQVNQNREELSHGLNHEGWARLYERLSLWDIEIAEVNDPGLKQIHHDQKKEFRREFSRYVEENYYSWLQGNGPIMSQHVLDRFVTPLLNRGERVYFIVIDCFRLDYWLAIEPILQEMFLVDRTNYYSLLPTATPFCRNSLFAGLLPSNIAKLYPDIWSHSPGHDEVGLNRYESSLLERYVERNNIALSTKPLYEKIVSNDNARALLKRIKNLKKFPFVCIVYSFVDLLSHKMSENEILQEIAPDENAFRSLTLSWFSYSTLRDILQAIADDGATIVLTTDHGSITGERASIVRGDRTTSTHVRYKYGRNLGYNPSEVFGIKDAAAYGLPSFGAGTEYLFAKEDYFLVFQNNYRHYEKLYKNTLQHGGISLEEMILPVGILRPR